MSTEGGEQVLKGIVYDKVHRNENKAKKRGESKMKKRNIMLAMAIAMALIMMAPSLGAGSAFMGGGLVLLNSHQFTWTDPASQGQVIMTENVYEGCLADTGEFLPHEMTFEYVVDNLTYDPQPGITNGFSGFQIVFPGPVPELHSQKSPIVGGPWVQNFFSGSFPPFGVEWDAQLPGQGILPGQAGTFSFCTFEREDVVVEAEGPGFGPAGWGHTWGDPVPEPIIDADGTVSPGRGIPGAVEVQIGDVLTSWPTGAYIEGLDWFDSDGTCTWTLGDDLHVEDPTTHPGAFRDGLHDDGLDPIVLDLDNSLNGTPGNEQVDVDLETSFTFTGCPGPDPLVKFFDTNGNGFWDDGEDIVHDLNNDGVFNFSTVANIQTFIHHGPQSVPGDLLYAGGIASSDNEIIAKKVKYMDEDRDGEIEVGEEVHFLEVIQVHNPSMNTWTNVRVQDRFGAEIQVNEDTASQGTVELTTKGKSEKVFLDWNIGTLGPGETANLVLRTQTDLNPAGHQEYTSCGLYDYNSGAVVKFLMPDGVQRSFETGEIQVSVVGCDG